MKILAIMGCSKFGNTTETVKCFLKYINENINSDIEYLYLSDFNLDFCTGCHNCIMIGEVKCPHYEVVKAIEDRIMIADTIILATPGYMFSVTGIMKNLLDHLAYNCHRPKYFDKKLFLIGNLQSMQKKGVFIPLEAFASGAKFQYCGKFYTMTPPFPLKKSELEKEKNKIKKSAQKLCDKLQSKTPRKLNFGDVAHFNVLKNLAEFAPNIMKADYEYFNKANVYDEKSSWFIDIKVPFLMNFFGKKLGKKVYKLFEKTADKNKIKKVEHRYLNRL